MKKLSLVLAFGFFMTIAATSMTALNNIESTVILEMVDNDKDKNKKKSSNKKSSCNEPCSKEAKKSSCDDDKKTADADKK